MKKTGIIGVLNNPATSINSHSAGMTNIVKELFNAQIINQNDDWDVYENLIIYHGINFREGSFNIIGGLNDDILKRSEKLSKYNGNLYTLDGFQLRDFSIKRKINLYNDFKTIEKIDSTIWVQSDPELLALFDSVKQIQSQIQDFIDGE